jgi:hypothetical protein
MMHESTVQNCIHSVLLEAAGPSVQRDASEYNFMSAANRLMRKTEARFGDACIKPIIEHIQDSNGQDPCARLYLDSLTRLLPGRQREYKLSLANNYPEWQSRLDSNPQDPLPEEFREASLAASLIKIPASQELCEVLDSAASSANLDVVKSAHKLIECVASTDFLWIIRKSLSQSDNPRRPIAILTASRLSPLDSDLRSQVISILLDGSCNISERVNACECLMASSSSASETFDVIKNLITTETDPTPFLNSLLDIPVKEVAGIIVQCLGNLSISALPDDTLHRVSRSQFVSQSLREEATRIFSARLEADLESGLASDRYGLLVHRNSSAGAVWVGHAGIFVSADEVIDCSTGRDPNAVRKIPFSQWKDGIECWGIRQDDDHPVDLGKAVLRAQIVSSWRTEYDGAHNNQKGKWFTSWFSDSKYWEADCVGFTEDCYERAGGDPTPSEFEAGSGWPLTVREQRDHMRKVLDC